MVVERNVDQQLVVRVQKGDKTAFDLLVLKYQHRIAKLVSRYVADRAEVVQTVRRSAGPGDIIVTMGAGDVWKLSRELAGVPA